MNILVVMCDHHRFDALSALGHPHVRTPHLDRLAARGVRFENCFTQAPVCAPARLSLNTGRYVHAHGVLDNLEGKPFPGLITLAHVLKPLGYRCFQVGHMHWTDPEMDNGYEPQVTPAMFNASLAPGAKARYAWEAQPLTRRLTAGPGTRAREEYSGHYMASRAIGMLEQAVERGEKFLCWLSFNEPHPPWYPPRELYAAVEQRKIRLPRQPPDTPPPHPEILLRRKEWAHLTDVERRQMAAGYYGMVSLVDGFIGQVLAALDRLGVRGETAVVWTSDHGEQLGEHGLYLKFAMRESSVRVPLILQLPRRRPALRGELVEHVDLFPTLCELAGARVPASAQGRSLAPLLGSRPAPAGWRDAVFSQMGSVRMIRTVRWKLNAYGPAPGELYDLRADPREFRNLVHDPAHAQTREALWRRLRDWESAHAEPSRSRVGEGVGD